MYQQLLPSLVGSYHSDIWYKFTVNFSNFYRYIVQRVGSNLPGEAKNES